MQLFRSQLSKYIPHPHRDSWMRNNLADWLQLLRIASFLILSAAAWNIFKAGSPIGVQDQLQPLLEKVSSLFINLDEPNESESLRADQIQFGIRCLFIALFVIAALTGFRCGVRRKPKYIIPVLISSILMLIAAIQHISASDYEIISITPYILPISIPILLVSYRPLANKLDHWNAYANVLCIITIFGSAFTYLFFPEKFPHLQESVFTSMGLPAVTGTTVMNLFSYFSIFAALLTTIARTRRLGLFVLIGIGAITCIYRITTLSLDHSSPVSLIITDAIFHTSYWSVPMLILLSLASRRKNLTLKI